MWDVTPLAKSKTTKIHFYSHIPCGMWQYCDLHIKSFREFLLTHPVWDVTMAFMCSSSTRNISTHTSRVGCDVLFALLKFVWQISTHTSRVGCDSHLALSVSLVSDFYSHIPCGMWLYHHNKCNGIFEFLLTHPVWDVTLYPINWETYQNISTHTSRVGCDH